MIATSAERVIPRLTIEPRPDGFWITGAAGDYGPYARRAEADDDRRGLIRTARFADEPNYVTVDGPARTEPTFKRREIR